MGNAVPRNVEREYYVMKNLKTLEFEILNRVAIISLNRPSEANGINYGIASELAYVAKECDNNAEIRVVILTAKGRFF